MPWGAIASGIGAFLGSKSGSTGTGVTDFDRNQFKYQKQLHKNQIQWQVDDAVKAGLHPLYALGNSMNYSPISSTGEQPQNTTGNAIGAGIQAAAGAYNQSRQKKAQAPLVASQTKANDAAAERDYAAAALSLSQIKRAEQEANATQDQDFMLSEAMRKSGFNSRQFATTPTEPIYIKRWNNLEKRAEWFPNPELNLEMPEAVGGIYFLNGKMHSTKTGRPLNYKQQQQIQKNFPKQLPKRKNPLNWGNAL